MNIIFFFYMLSFWDVNWTFFSLASGELNKKSLLLLICSAPFDSACKLRKLCLSSLLSTSNMSLLNNAWEAMTSCNDIITRIMRADYCLSVRHGLLERWRNNNNKKPHPGHMTSLSMTALLAQSKYVPITFKACHCPHFITGMQVST